MSSGPFNIVCHIFTENEREKLLKLLSATKRNKKWNLIYYLYRRYLVKGRSFKKLGMETSQKLKVKKYFLISIIKPLKFLGDTFGEIAETAVNYVLCIQIWYQMVKI